MKNILIKLARYIIRQGFFKGISILIKFNKKDGLIKVKPKNVKSPLWLRADSSDVPTFDEIFIAEQYEFDYGFIPETIIDCGANIGLTTIYYKNKFPNSTIISVEPELSNFKMLKKNVSDYDNVFCINAGVWNKETLLKGSDKYGTEKWAFSVEEIEKNAIDENTIPSISINTILEKYSFSKIDILKVDIEGAEIELFSKHTENWLPKTKCIVIELHDRFRKGTGKAFFKASSNYDFSYYQNGVNLFCINNNL